MDLQRIAKRIDAFDWTAYNEFHGHAEEATAHIDRGSELMGEGAGDAAGARTAATAGLAELAQARIGAPTAALAHIDEAVRLVQQGIDVLAPNKHTWIGYRPSPSVAHFTNAIDRIQAADEAVYAPMRFVEAEIRGEVSRERAGDWHSE